MSSITLPTDTITTKFPSLGAVVFESLKYVYVIAGMSMLVMLIWGGILLMTAAGDPGQTKAGYGKMQSGIAGFVIIFLAYFIAQIVQVIFGVKFL